MYRPRKIGALQASRQLRHLRAETPGLRNPVFFNTRSGPLAGERVRKALLQSVDLDQLVGILYFGRCSRAWATLTPTTPYHSAESGRPFRMALPSSLTDI